MNEPEYLWDILGVYWNQHLNRIDSTTNYSIACKCFFIVVFNDNCSPCLIGYLSKYHSVGMWCVQVGSWILRTSILLWRCLMSCWMSAQNFVKEENLWQAWEVSSAQRYIPFTDSSNKTGCVFPFSWKYMRSADRIGRTISDDLHLLLAVFCRCNSEQQRSGKMLTRPLNLCNCVWSVTCWRWSAVLTGLTAWMTWGWGPLACMRLYQDWIVHSRGSYSNIAHIQCSN